MSQEKIPGYGHFSAYKKEIKIIAIEKLSYSKEYLLKEYKGTEAIPDSLMSVYIKFATCLKLCDKAEIGKYLADDIRITDTFRNSDKADYGTDININFLRNHFQPQILSVGKDSENVYLIRTVTTALWFRLNLQKKWILEKYLDKPIL